MSLCAYLSYFSSCHYKRVLFIFSGFWHTYHDKGVLFVFFRVLVCLHKKRILLFLSGFRHTCDDKRVPGVDGTFPRSDSHQEESIRATTEKISVSPPSFVFVHLVITVQIPDEFDLKRISRVYVYKCVLLFHFANNLIF